MKIVVTGGAGFLGYHIAQRINEITEFNNTVFFDIAEFEKNEYDSNINCIYGDVRNPKLTDEIIRGADVVIHCAAALPLWKKKDIFETNVDGMRNVCESCLKFNVNKLIFISSTAVYGVPKIHPIYENHERIGVGNYGKSKIMAEDVCFEYQKKGLTVCIIRPKSFIGTARLGVFQILYDWIESGARIPIIGRGNNRYQLFEVEDLVDAIFIVCKMNNEKINDVFNVGAKLFKTVKEDVEVLLDYAKSGSKILTTPAWLIKKILRLFEVLKLSPLYKWIYGTADTDSFVSIEKAENILDWHPKYSNSEALIRSYQWYLDNINTIKQGTGITHRIAWKQGILSIFKKILK